MALAPDDSRKAFQADAPSILVEQSRLGCIGGNGQDADWIDPEEILRCLAPFMSDRSLPDPSLVREFLEKEGTLDTIKDDLHAYVQRDPATSNTAEVIGYSKGFRCSTLWRLSHYCAVNGLTGAAKALHYMIQERLGCDLHPEAEIGPGLMLDHCFSIVVGATARAGRNLTMYHGATLGARHIEDGDRHPKLGNGVLVGCGAKVLGNIRIGDRVRIGAGAVVLEDLPAGSTAVGQKCRIIHFGK